MVAFPILKHGRKKFNSEKSHYTSGNLLSNPPLLHAVLSAWAEGVYAVECFAAQAVLGEMSGQTTFKQDGNYNAWSHFQFSSGSVESSPAKNCTKRRATYSLSPVVPPCSTFCVGCRCLRCRVLCCSDHITNRMATTMRGRISNSRTGA